jgi:hypothetical protein
LNTRPTLQEPALKKYKTLKVVQNETEKNVSVFYSAKELTKMTSEKRIPYYEKIKNIKQ